MAARTMPVRAAVTVTPGTRWWRKSGRAETIGIVFPCDGIAAAGGRATDGDVTR
jgi:hypothetical protein